MARIEARWTEAVAAAGASALVIAVFLDWYGVALLVTVGLLVGVAMRRLDLRTRAVAGGARRRPRLTPRTSAIDDG